MGQMRIQCKLADLELDATLSEGLNVFARVSACGKTRAFKAMHVYALLNNIKLKYVNYQNYEGTAWNDIEGFDIVILDDADLYMGSIKYEEIVKKNKIVVTDVKQVKYTMSPGLQERSIHVDADKIVIS